MTLYKLLKRLGPGLHRCKPTYWIFSNGWIEIGEADDEHGTRSVMWCDSKHGHSNLSGPAFSVEVDQNDGIIWVFKSTTSMHPVRDDYARRIFYQRILALVKAMAPPRFYYESDDGHHYVVDRYANPGSEQGRTDVGSCREGKRLAKQCNEDPPWPAWDDIQAERDEYEGEIQK